jgi:hypothetical protein
MAIYKRLIRVSTMRIVLGALVAVMLALRLSLILSTGRKGEGFGSGR